MLNSNFIAWDLTLHLLISDERIIEYDIDKVLFDKRSEFQKIQIVHSKTLGNMLILDELQNIAEADLIYTETLMQRGKVNYEGKEICILGGGDGALLYELLKENPKHVVMLEIDDLVMEACNKYMNSICGDVLEVRKRENYEIIVGDCMVWLEKYIKEGKKFDYVFGDLTDIPISDTPTGEIWDFIRTILEKSFKVLKSDGWVLIYFLDDSVKIEIDFILLEPSWHMETVNRVPSLSPCTRINWRSSQLPSTSHVTKHLFLHSWRIGYSIKWNLQNNDKFEVKILLHF